MQRPGRHSGCLQQAVAEAEAGEVGSALFSRDLECQAKRLGFHPRGARKTLKRDKMSLTLWKGALQLSGGWSRAVGKAGG